MSNGAWRNLVASCTALVAAMTFVGEHGDGAPHVHSAETDASFTFMSAVNWSPSVTGGWQH
jgi:hypothetical protein